MTNRLALSGLVILGALSACSSNDGSSSSTANGGGPNGSPSGSDTTSAPLPGGATTDPTGSSSGGAVVPTNPTDLCAGLVTDKAARPMSALAKPALGQTVIDPEFKTKIRRVTSVAQTGANPAIRPLYSTVSAFNADESKFILFNVSGRHELYDGKTYAFLRGLDELSPPDIEQLYWSTTDPDVLYLVENKDFIAYHVSTATKQKLTSFSFCTAGASGGSDPMFTSFDSHRIGLKCGGQVFLYDIASNKVLAQKAINENPPQVAPSGTLAFLSDSGRVTDASLNVLRTLDLKEPFGHASMGRSPTGADYWAGQVFDNGPNGNDDIGNLVVFDLGTGAGKTIIGPKTGYPYPPDGHISSLAYKNPGWAFVSTFGKTSGAGLLDLEILVANTTTSTVCRVGRHRSWGKDNTKLGEPYWAEAHAVPSPSGTRLLFASDWGNGATVDTYVLELPSYVP